MKLRRRLIGGVQLFESGDGSIALVDELVLGSVLSGIDPDTFVVVDGLWRWTPILGVDWNAQVWPLKLHGSLLDLHLEQVHLLGLFVHVGSVDEGWHHNGGGVGRG